METVSISPEIKAIGEQLDTLSPFYCSDTFLTAVKNVLKLKCRWEKNNGSFVAWNKHLSVLFFDSGHDDYRKDGQVALKGTYRIKQEIKKLPLLPNVPRLRYRDIFEWKRKDVSWVLHHKLPPLIWMKNDWVWWQGSLELWNEGMRVFTFEEVSSTLAEDDEPSEALRMEEIPTDEMPFGD